MEKPVIKLESGRLATIVDRLKEHGGSSITFYTKNQVEHISFLQMYKAIAAAFSPGSVKLPAPAPFPAAP